MDIQEAAKAAKAASIQLAAADTETKHGALKAIAGALDVNREAIVADNREDLQISKKNNLEAPLLKRLQFDEKKIDDVIAGIQSLIGLPDPVGATQSAMEMDKGLELYKVSCPIGVIGVIFESRPDALVQISTLGLKSGNAVLLKGGAEAANTNRTLAFIIREASEKAAITSGWIQLLETLEDVSDMLKLDELIDLIIPRGSNEFVRYIMDHSRIPVLGHADGICHVYVDAAADLNMAGRIAVDAKCQYVAVCNAMETLLVNAAVAADFLPGLQKALEEQDVEIRGCEKTRSFIDVAVAGEEDWKTEYLDSILSIKVVESLQEAIDHINTYGSGHTDAIVTASAASAALFMDLCDSGNVFWNCSTRFSDGFRYGLGAEVGVSTNKVHARGPVGLEGLVIYKWKLRGRGEVVADYAGGKKQFTHKPLSKPFSTL